MSDTFDTRLWLDGFEDQATIEAWIVESADGTVQYVDGGSFIHFSWDSVDAGQLAETGSKSMALDQLNWPAMDMTSFTQDKTPVDRLQS